MIIILYQYYNNKIYTRNIVKKRINQSFKKLYNEVTKENRNKLRDIILEKMNFSLFFECELKEIKENIYNSMNIEELLIDKNIKNNNKFLLITFFAHKKIEEKGFLEILENSYVVNIEIDDFVKEMKQKLKEIKSIKELYKYIWSEIAKNKDELQIIIEGYKRAKEKGYIENNKKKRNNIWQGKAIFWPKKVRLL